jgi:signal transduction histidine kinase
MHAYSLLIVDDDAIDRRLYCKSLTQHGPDTCHIQQAVDGATGLAALRADQFDCVLLDFNLPDMTGLKFLAAAAVDGELPCAVVLVTGQGNEAIAVEAMKRGVQDYLVKDQVNANNLWRTLTQAMTQAELKQRLAASLRDLTASHLALEQEVATRKAAEVELRTAKDAAEQGSLAKTRFVAMVTHELRTPLNGILGYAQLLRIEGGLSTRQDAHVGAMMQAGRHLLDMIERVLDFASIETGSMELHPTEVSVRDLTEACIAFISPMAAERVLSLRIIRSHDAPQQIVVDPARLRQVLLNLLGNAVKYTDAGGVELRLLAGASPDGLRVEVADTGRGIDEASRDRLFQDFERLDAATSVEGTGLGLAIAARIVKLMGGMINYAPNPNGGSMFWFELPMASLASPSLQAPLKSPSPLSGQRVLLVDDIKINRDIVGSFLNAAGRTVTLAESGKEAVQLAAEQQFDLILMDVRMPEMDGLDAAQQIRALPGRYGQVPILALTAYTFPDQVAQCRDAGMDGHVPKPVDYETLMRAIDDAVARHMLWGSLSSAAFGRE